MRDHAKHVIQERRWFPLLLPIIVAISLLIFSGAFALTYGPGVWEQMQKQTELFPWETGFLAGITIKLPQEIDRDEKTSTCIDSGCTYRMQLSSDESSQKIYTIRSKVDGYQVTTLATVIIDTRHRNVLASVAWGSASEYRYDTVKRLIETPAFIEALQTIVEEEMPEDVADGIRASARAQNYNNIGHTTFFPYSERYELILKEMASDTRSTYEYGFKRHGSWLETRDGFIRENCYGYRPSPDVKVWACKSTTDIADGIGARVKNAAAPGAKKQKETPGTRDILRPKAKMPTSNDAVNIEPLTGPTRQSSLVRTWISTVHNLVLQVINWLAP